MIGNSIDRTMKGGVPIGRLQKLIATMQSHDLRRRVLILVIPRAVAIKEKMENSPQTEFLGGSMGSTPGLGQVAEAHALPAPIGIPPAPVQVTAASVEQIPLEWQQACGGCGIG